MWDPRRLTTLWAFTACYRDSFTLPTLPNRRHHLDAPFFFFFAQVYHDLNPALPSWKMLAFMFFSAILGTSPCLEFVPLINTVLLLGAPVLPTRWVKILTYLQSEQFLSIIFCNLLLKFLIIFKALCHGVLSYYILCVFLFIFFFASSVLMCFLSSVLVCNLSLSCCQALQ
jgi:hypothetical protein